MNQVLKISQIIVSIITIGLILIQARGTGLGRSSGGSTSSFTRRGLEKLIFRLTFVFVAIFLLLAIINLLV